MQRPRGAGQNDSRQSGRPGTRLSDLRVLAAERPLPEMVQLGRSSLSWSGWRSPSYEGLSSLVEF